VERREAIARIIDPENWRRREVYLADQQLWLTKAVQFPNSIEARPSQYHDGMLTVHRIIAAWNDMAESCGRRAEDVVQPSLRKADQIIALG
jgi:hypothetical protein